ncbi:MAG: hypothetical protein KBD94_00235 [Pyrinomonadaceae bacterium]|nr:hypothetical protein [Pyrinomonadaceae bacterium]
MNHIDDDDDDDMKPHYDFDYSKSKPNRFAEKYNKMVRHVGLAADVADEFPTEDSVNDALREYLRITRNSNVEVSTR